MSSQVSVEREPAPGEIPPWRDPARSCVERAEALIALMALEEKIAQLVGVWVGADATGVAVAPHQADMGGGVHWPEVIRHGLGQLTRPFGTAPVEPATGAKALAAAQAEIAANNRFGIPAQVHEECLTGFAAWGATVYPTPLSWGAAFDPELVEQMAGRIGAGMRAAGGIPSTYLAPPLGRRSEVSAVDPTAAYPFGHGLGYTEFDWTDATVPGPDGQPAASDGPVDWPVDAEVSVAVQVRNLGTRAGTEVVQLYLHDPVAQTTRPVVRLVGYARVPLAAGEQARVTFAVPADVTSFTGVHGRRIVEPGAVELRFGRSSARFEATVPLRLVGDVREVGHQRRLVSLAAVEPTSPPAPLEAHR